MIRAGHLRSRIGLAAAESGCRWFLPIVLGIICANGVGPTPAAAGEEPPLTPIARITRALEHQNITVEAVISQVAEPQNGKPYYVTLVQGTATIPLIYWSDIQPQLGPKVRVGNSIRAKVTVSTYREQLQLRIRDPNDLQVIGGVTAVTTNAAPAVAAAVAPRATATTETPPIDTVIGKIKADWADRPVIISGTVSDFRTAGKVWQLKVQDRTGEIAVVLGEKALAGLTVTELKPGWVVAVTGPVKVYQGIPAVVPEVAGAVKVTPQ